jgi:hypothetical protein
LKMQEKKPLEWRPYERGTINNALMTGTTFGGGTASLIFSR